MRSISESDKKIVKSMIVKPHQNIEARFLGADCSISVGIPEYPEKLMEFYGAKLLPSLQRASVNAGVPFALESMGLIIHFHEPQKLYLHDDNMCFIDGIREIIAEFGAIIIKNAYLADEHRDMGHRNRFPHLRFHRDRNEHQPTPYSLYTRDPFCEEQKFPRISSTLFTANLVAYLQCLRQKDFEQIGGKGMQPAYQLFENEDMSAVLGQIVLEHCWNEPEGVGEISMLDNRTMLHSSYYPQNKRPGYRIGVRYLC